ncbi:MAG TPA: TauD/TfdA family dioxygenase [Rhizomicrobium sp.]|nr:TauD/TfdA family dioxygenase [Rhizomicrobium sp.]
MALELQPVGNEFVAEAAGVSLAHLVDQEIIARIDEAMSYFAVLVFRDQPLNPSEQISLARQFGELDLGLRRATLKGADKARIKSRFEEEALLDISNVRPDGKVADRGDRMLLSNMANQLWHSDSSFQQDPVSYSMLSAVVVPPSGGDTEFADMRAAYEALDDNTNCRIADLKAEHFAFHSRELLGFVPSDAERNAIPPATWPVVRSHRHAPRRSLFIGAHARSIDHMPIPEARVLLMDLLEHATQPQFVYRHKWRMGDFVMWDNRTTLHRGRHFDLTQRRELRRTTILDRVGS